jgi:glycine/D-amino acid oxidase-like deaminating enzyme
MAPAVIVVGGGVIGSSVAYRLARGGARVTLLDAGPARAGTSWTSFAWVNASSKRPRAYFELNYAGVRAHRRLAEELGEAPWWAPTGHLRWAGDEVGEASLLAEAGTLAGWGYGACTLAPGEARELEPGVVLPAGAGRVVSYEEEGWLDTPSFIQAMRRLAAAHGAHVVESPAPVALAARSGHVVGVERADGTRLAADWVVTCVGRWTEELLAPLDVAIPLVTADRPGAAPLGMLVETEPLASPPRRILRGPDVALRPERGGRVRIHSNLLDVELAPGWAPSPDLPLARRALELAAGILPALRGVAIERVLAGLRVLPRDGISIAGWAPGVEGCYVVATHSGVTLAAILGELIASEVGAGTPAALLEPFRPARFAGVAGAAELALDD